MRGLFFAFPRYLSLVGNLTVMTGEVLFLPSHIGRYYLFEGFLTVIFGENVKIFHNSEDFSTMCSSTCDEDVYRIEAKRVQD